MAAHLDAAANASSLAPRNAPRGLSAARPRPTLLLAVAAVALAAGCGGDAGPPPAVQPAEPPPVSALPRSDDPTAVPQAPLPPGATPAMEQTVRSAPAGSIVWTTETDPATGAPLSQLEAIDPGAPRIVAALPVSLGPSPIVVSAEWSYNNTDMPAVGSRHTLSPGDGVVWVSFALEAAPGASWPQGTYRVLVSFDAAPAATGAVDVRPGG